ncbi:hypothetical protein QBC46DRAFT_396303 [Diplogelasinospora grovesii]|uniref:UBC core domain-containing protein n=1 Tax=Diplogelasinospora grovesii TaxID=303347 RepID=A0AAN6S0F7_9PEZI|nr:hypothetical protein QBC46DRAFT_396303 [Diplogelasinospora grovesii]
MTVDGTFLLEYRQPSQSATPASSETTLRAQSSVSPPRMDKLSISDMFASSEVYVRWITTDAAVSTANLSAIPADPHPFRKDTTLDDLYRTAVTRLCAVPRRSSRCTDPERLNLWLKECQLFAENNPTTLGEMGLAGSSRKPLDIFVEIVGPTSRNALSQVSVSTTSNPGTVWDFNASPRGFSTFVTSLAILLKEIEQTNVELESVLELLLQLTKFPPVLTAFCKVQDTGLEKQNVDVGALLLVADLFSHVCEAMVPGCIYPSADRKLEGSRQIMAWIAIICASVHPSSDVVMPSCVKRVQITRHLNGLNGQAQALFGNEVIAALPTLQRATTASPIEGSATLTQQVRISAETPKDGDVDELAKKCGIALAFSPSLFDRWNYYFDSPVSWSEFLSTPKFDHPKVAEFDVLIAEANKSPAFRLVDPMNLGACLSSELPVITLSAKGFVSTYDQMDVACGEREFYLWNALEKTVAMRQSDPGQYISQQLDAIIKDRKKGGSWEVDAWSEWSAHATHGDPDESIVICVDRSGSMGRAMPPSWYPKENSGMSTSRLMEVKEFFKHFSTRLSSYNIRIHTGLVAFNTNVSVIQPLNDNQLNFREKLEDISEGGNTSIFDALAAAKNMLVAQKRAYPKTKCRIVLLTDGADNSSTIAARTVSQELYTSDIVLDAILIAADRPERKATDLFKICRQTGGYAFKPEDQQVFFQIFLLETMVDIRTRPDIVKCPVADWATFTAKPPDMRDSFGFPPCRPHPNQSDYFVCLGEAQRFQRRVSRYTPSRSPSLSSAASSTSTVTGNRVVINEINAIVRNPHPHMDVYVSTNDMRFWKVAIEGPPGSPYQDGVFLLFVDIVPEFPRLPPAVRFITPMLHPNISKHGRVCHPIFDREWNSNIRVLEVLQQLYGILMSLEARDAIDPISTLKFYTDREAGEQLVRDYVSRFATRSRQQLREDIVGDDTSTIASTTSAVSETSSVVSGRTLTPSRSQAQSPTKSPSLGFAAGSVRSLSTVSSSVSGSAHATSNNIRDHLASQRGVPPRPPPLVASSTTGHANNPANRSTQTLALSEANVQALSQTDAPDGLPELPGVSGSGKRTSRRASFFAKLPTS